MQSLMIAIVSSLTVYRQQRVPVPSDSLHPLPILDEPYLSSYNSLSANLLLSVG